jgi:hypothetical protein
MTWRFPHRNIPAYLDDSSAAIPRYLVDTLVGEANNLGRIAENPSNLSSCGSLHFRLARCQPTNSRERELERLQESPEPEIMD